MGRLDRYLVWVLGAVYGLHLLWERIKEGSTDDDPTAW